jgi:hypothetical protein
MRFRKSIKILPGLKLNITQNGISSVSIGKRGATLNVGGKQGPKMTVGLPGTGLSHTVRLGSGQHRPRGSAAQRFVGPLDGAAVNEAEYERQLYVQRLNQHYLIRRPTGDAAEPYRSFMPAKPAFRVWPVLLTALSFIAFVRLLAKPSAETYSAEFVALVLLLLSGGCLLADAVRRIKWAKAAGRVVDLMRSAQTGHGAAVEAVLVRDLDEAFGAAGAVSDVRASPDGAEVSLDVSLPKIQDLAQAVPPSRFSKAGIRAERKKEQAVRDDYRLLAHATLVRAAAEVFLFCPTVRMAVLSGWSALTDPSTGHPVRACLLSVAFDRAIWDVLNPAEAEPVDLVGRFANRRHAAPDGALLPVQAFPPV